VVAPAIQVAQVTFAYWQVRLVSTALCVCVCERISLSVSFFSLPPVGKFVLYQRLFVCVNISLSLSRAAACGRVAGVSTALCVCVNVFLSQSLSLSAACVQIRVVSTALCVCVCVNVSLSLFRLWASSCCINGFAFVCVCERLSLPLSLSAAWGQVRVCVNVSLSLSATGGQIRVVSTALCV
jgi:hypothetical protein